MRRRPSICDSCDRLRKRANPGAVSTLDKWIPYCEAFPDRVPKDIYVGQFDHRQPHPGDNGIRYVLREGRESVLESYEISVARRREHETEQENN